MSWQPYNQHVWTICDKWLKVYIIQTFDVSSYWTQQYQECFKPAKPVLDSLVYILARLKYFKCRLYFPQLQNSLVTRHQIFCVCPAASSKNRVWTHSLVKLVCPRICCLQRQLPIQLMWCNSIPQYTPVHPSTPQYTPVHVSTCPSILQYTPVYPSTCQYMPKYSPVYPSIPQYISVHPSIPQFSLVPRLTPVHVI